MAYTYGNTQNAAERIKEISGIRTFSLMIKGMLTKLSRFITERMLMRQAMTVPNTVARAAPVIPSLGKPRFPWISR